MYQQLYIYASPDRQRFRYSGEEIIEFPVYYPGFIWPIQLPETALPD